MKDNKMNDLLGMIDDKILKTKLNQALELIKNGDSEQLAKKLKGVDKNDLIEKLDQIDSKKLKDMNINKAELANNINKLDINKLTSALGSDGNDLLKKLNSLIDKKLS